MAAPDVDYCTNNAVKTSGTGPEFYLFQRTEASRLTKVADPTGLYEGEVLRMECREGDMNVLSSGTSRVEAQGHRVLTIGSTYWWETDLWIPTTVPKVGGGTGFLTIMSIFGDPGSGSSPFRWDIKGDRFGISTSGNDRAWQEPSANAKANIYGKWITMRVKTKFSSSGYVEAWLRIGEAPMKQLTFWKSGESQNNEGHGPESTKWEFNAIQGIETANSQHVKIDQYRRTGMSGWGNEVFYFTSLRVASTQENVANPFGFTYDGEEPVPPEAQHLRPKGGLNKWTAVGKANAWEGLADESAATGAKAAKK